MKKVLLAMMVGLTAFGISMKASASARLDSMTADSREVDDIDLIWLYPNKVLDYKNTVDFQLAPEGDFGEGTDEWGGVLTELSPDLGVLGVYVNRPLLEASSSLQAFSGIFPHSAFPIFPVPIVGINQNVTGGVEAFTYANIVDLFWAKNLGGMNLGIRFSYGSEFEDFEQVDNLGLSVGLGLTNVGPFNQLNFHADYNVVDATESEVQNNGIFTIKEGALASSDLDQDDSLKLFLDLRQDQFRATDEAIPAIDDISQFASDLGLSMNHKIQGGKGLVSTGLIFDYVSMSSKAGVFPFTLEPFNIDTWILVWNASLEYPVLDWLTLRTGLAKAVVARAYDSINLEGNGIYYDGTGSPVAFNVGFGINWQNWILDANVDVSSLEDSINGVQPGNGIFFTNGDPIAQVVSADLKYKF